MDGVDRTMGPIMMIQWGPTVDSVRTLQQRPLFASNEEEVFLKDLIRALHVYIIFVFHSYVRPTCNS